MAMNAVAPNSALIFLLKFIIVEFGILSFNYEKGISMVFLGSKFFYFFLFFISEIRVSSTGDFISTILSDTSFGTVIEST